jgi:hypothetical protein
MFTNGVTEITEEIPAGSACPVHPVAHRHRHDSYGSENTDRTPPCVLKLAMSPNAPMAPSAAL